MRQEDFRTDALFDLKRSFFGSWLARYAYPWELLEDIPEAVRQIGRGLNPERYEQTADDVWLAKSLKISGQVSIEGPAVIGENCELRPGAYIRGAVLTGKNCILGNSCEFKNCILLDHVEVPHFSYVGDSVLGNDCHFGAGVITSNFRQDHGFIKIHLDESQVLLTHLEKMGAMVGDGCEIGCHAVLNPGSLLGRRARVYPLTQTRRALPAGSILKNDLSISPLIADS